MVRLWRKLFPKRFHFQLTELNRLFAVHEVLVLGSVYREIGGRINITLFLDRYFQ